MFTDGSPLRRRPGVPALRKTWGLTWVNGQTRGLSERGFLEGVVLLVSGFVWMRSLLFFFYFIIVIVIITIFIVSSKAIWFNEHCISQILHWKQNILQIDHFICFCLTIYQHAGTIISNSWEIMAFHCKIWHFEQESWIYFISIKFKFWDWKQPDLLVEKWDYFIRFRLFSN